MVFLTSALNLICYASMGYTLRHAQGVYQTDEVSEKL